MKENSNNLVIRNFKDTLFRKLFSDKANLLSLYNLMSNQCYTDPEQLTIVTLDNAIYMNMKNDLAFLIDNTICMYEHQSTLSPNLPLRNLFYVAREFEKIVSSQTLYSSKRIYLPAPYFVVFYNGSKTDWTMRKSKLSDSFWPMQGAPKMELIVDEININLGVNDALLRQCAPLYEYMQYIDRVRTYSATLALNQAVEMAINECIMEGILADFLLQNKSEAIQMSIFEYDEEREMKLIRADEREIGREQGIELGIIKGREQATISNAKGFISYDLAQNVDENLIIQKVMTIFGLTLDVVQSLVLEVQMYR